MITTTKTKFVVQCTTVDGRVLWQNPYSLHWSADIVTTSKANAERLLEVAIAKHTTSTYTLVDVEVLEGAAKFFTNAKNAHLAANGYFAIPKSELYSDEAFRLRKEAIKFAKKAKAGALAALVD